MHTDALVTSLIGLVVVLLIFLICREVICWYWKINKVVELLEKQNKLLTSILESRKEKF